MTEFNPLVYTYNSLLRKEFATLKDDATLAGIFTEPPLLALRQPPNLRSLLTSSKLYTQRERGNKCCMKPRCQICQHITTGDHVRIPNVNFPLRPPPLTCDTKNVIYIFYCNICNEGNYVGETGTQFRLRFNNHKKSIRDNFSGFPVAKHFNLPGHSIDNLKCILIANNFSSPSQRKSNEIEWIFRLQTNTVGLNIDLGPLNGLNFYKFK